MHGKAPRSEPQPQRNKAFCNDRSRRVGARGDAARIITRWPDYRISSFPIIRSPNHKITQSLGLRAAGGFTILEVLVVAGIIALLVGMLVPGLGRARDQGAAVVCKSNLRQLFLANELYARDTGGAYVPGAARIRSQNLDRWHGRRTSRGVAFNGEIGPLAPYLGADGRIRSCPTLYIENPAKSGTEHFEAGCGGYGYNNAYLGVRNPFAFADPGELNTLSGAPADRIRKPAGTIMFADAAFAGEALIEYSFAEPRFHPQFASRADPSIHFRHGKHAQTVWCDGHISSERRTFTWSQGFYSLDPDRNDIGWFGEADDNSLFDLN